MEGASSSAPVHFFDDHRPRCHLAPPAGWMNDPNGPVYYKGRYHMFYQHLPDACEWDFGIIWGHAVSSDLVHWEHLPPALVPTPGWVDADGCFSGSCVLDSHGRPVILYTGVRLRSNTSAGPLPPPEQDLGMVWIESQCAAVPADPNDDLLINWRKIEAPFLPLPPAELQLTGWRDPFVFQYNTLPTEGIKSPLAFLPQDGPPEYRILMGSGIKGQGGTALVYRSNDLMQGWELEGQLCVGSTEDSGVVWECPLLVPLTPVPHHLRSKHPKAPPPWLHANGQKEAAKVRIPENEELDVTEVSLGTPTVKNKGVLTSPLAALNVQPASGGSGGGGGGGGLSTSLGGLSSSVDAPNSRGNVNKSASRTSLKFPSPRQQHPSSSSLKEQHEEFEFSSGGQSPLESPRGLGAGSQREDSIEFWPSSAEATSPNVESDEPPSPKNIGAASGAARGFFGATGDVDSVAAELSKKLERAATLEHWNPSDSEKEKSLNGRNGGNGNGSEATFSPGENDVEEERESSVSANSATIGSKLDSAASGALGTKDLFLNEFIVAPPEEPPSSAGAAVDAASSQYRCPTSFESSRSQSPSRRNLPASPFSTSTAGTADDVSEDKFALAFSKVPAVQLKPAAGKYEPSPAGITEMLAQMSIYNDVADGEGLSRQWHFFTISPDAPTNPVLYWTGFVTDPTPEECGISTILGSRNSSTSSLNSGNDGSNGSAPQFEIDTAKGPFRLDLGDILYAPNVCQDDQGRWLLWGWLQERRKVGSYSYAGCLSLPRILHVTDEGRLLQAPAPEVSALRKGREFHAEHVTLYPEAIVPIQHVCGDRLDIECTIERGSAIAAGLLFRSHEAEAEGSTAIVYDWDRNHLEAIFNVPPNWQPHVAASAALHHHLGSDIFDDHDGGVFDAAAYLCTPRYPLSRTASLSVFSPDASSPLATPDQPIAESPPSPLESSVSGSLPSTAAVGSAPGVPIRKQGSSLSMCLQRTSSFAALGTSFPGVAGTTAGGGGLPRTSSTGAFGAGVPRVGSFIPRQSSFVMSPTHSQAILDAAEAAEMDAELSNLLEDLAAPMRGADEEPHAPPVEPRRVGGPLLMHPSDRLHLRIIVDHSLVEVFAGTGEVLSTRIYRGKHPDANDDFDAGIEFVAFGGAAILEKVSAFECGSAWPAMSPTATPTAASAAGETAHVGGRSASGTPKSATAAAAAATGRTILSPSYGSTSSLGQTAADRANELFDDILMGIGPAPGASSTAQVAAGTH